MIKELTNGLSWWTIEAEGYYWPEISTQTWSTPHTKGFSKNCVCKFEHYFIRSIWFFNIFIFFPTFQNWKFALKK